MKVFMNGKNHGVSGVQRVLDARGQLGFWMPTKSKEVFLYRFIFENF